MLVSALQYSSGAQMEHARFVKGIVWGNLRDLLGQDLMSVLDIFTPAVHTVCVCITCSE